MPGAPCYDWTCRACQAANRRGTGACASCGFKARYTGAELAAVKGRMAPVQASLAEIVALIGLAVCTGAFYLLIPSDSAWFMFGPKLALLCAVGVAGIPALLLWRLAKARLR